MSFEGASSGFDFLHLRATLQPVTPPAPPESSPEPTPDPLAESIYARFRAASERGEGPSLEQLLASHPAQADALRQLHQRQERFLRLIAGAGDAPRPELEATPFLRRDRAFLSQSRARPQAQVFREGDHIGDYQLVRWLGKGGMGQVWEAQQNSMGRRVALKLLLHAHSDPKVIADFQREALAAARVHHPNLVCTYARGESRGIEWIAMELVPGSYSLRDTIEDLRLEEQLPEHYYRRIARLVQEIARGMEAAHRAGIIHRDLKPQNILLDEREHPKVADFGLARLVDASSVLTQGALAGTYYYMSPEQVRHATVLGPATDVYSLGVVLYELLTLRRPFTGDSPPQIIDQILHADAVDPCQLRSQCPRDLAQIALKAMNKEIGQRYASMEAFADDLGRHLRHEPIAARPLGRSDRMRKWILRHPVASASLAISTMATVTIAGLAVYAFAKASEATRSAIEAETAALAAKEKAEDVQSLSVFQILEDLNEQADQLWPVSRALVPRYEDWIRRAGELIEGRPAHAAAGLPAQPGLMQHRADREQLRARALPADQDRVEPAHAAADARFRYLAVEDAWWDTQYSHLIENLEALVDESGGGLATAGISERHGWGVPRRLSEALRIAELTVESEAARTAWSSALSAIATSPVYEQRILPRGRRLGVIEGLLPIGPDPQTGLWEFAHAASGRIPERSADGRLVLSEESCIVLVLLPGARFAMGCQRNDPAAPNYDPEAAVMEGPVHEALAEAFLISKFELSQAQWERLTGSSPSLHSTEYNLKQAEWDQLSKTQQSLFAADPRAKITRMHPVEQVSWSDCSEQLPRTGLRLPSEVEWEYAARGGTSTPWWTGQSRESMSGAASIADRSALQLGAVWPDLQEWPEFEDGHALHGPMGCTRANPLGLHEIIGNVWEWTADPLTYYTRPNIPESNPRRILRGGCFVNGARLARSAARDNQEPHFRYLSIGVRPAMTLPD